MRWLTFKELCEKCSVKRAMMYRIVFKEDFPKPRRITPSSKGNRWREDEVDAWINSQTVSNG